MRIKCHIGPGQEANKSEFAAKRWGIIFYYGESGHAFRATPIPNLAGRLHIRFVASLISRLANVPHPCGYMNFDH
jgi:hypothetical protein